MTNALRQIRSTWAFILGESQTHQRLIDANTIHILQGRCPFRCLRDRTYLHIELRNDNILPGVSPMVRDAVYQRILMVQHTIPTIYTFLENTKILEPCAKILQGILPSTCKDSLAQAFRSLHNGQTRFKEQISAFTYVDRVMSTGEEVEWFSYRQLWLLLFRHFPSPRKDTSKWKNQARSTGKRKRGSNQCNDDENSAVGQNAFREQWVRELAMLASTNGYQQIRKGHSGIKSADAVMAESFLIKVRPPEYYVFGAGLLGDKVSAICKVLQDIEETTIGNTRPEITSEVDTCGSDIDDRCGRPQEHSVNRDKQNLFLAYVYDMGSQIVPKQYMTSFAWKLDMFHAFFGQSPSTTIASSVHTEAQGHTLSPVPQVVAQSTGQVPVALKPEHPSLLEGSVHGANGNPVDASPIEKSSDTSRLVEQHSKLNSILSLTEVRQLLFGEGRSNSESFLIISPADSQDCFHQRFVDPQDKIALVDALGLASPSHLLSAEEGRLKLVDPTTVVEHAATHQLKIVVIAPQHGSQSLIDKLESWLALWSKNRFECLYLAN